MPCYHPLSAYKTAAGAVVFVERGDIVASLFLPCGQCIGCRLERSRQWAIRITHEAAMWDENCFITLTYDNAHVTDTLRYEDFKLFMKKLRKGVGCVIKGCLHDESSDCKSVRFFCCGEYGDDFQRPHFHACIFGTNFGSDRIIFKRSGGGFDIFRSARLESLWGMGFSSVGELTFESAAYVARYVCKKVTGEKEAISRRYRKVDVETGEITMRQPELAHMSLKPGIGAKWFEKYKGEVFPLDRVIARGVPSKPPKYYDYLAKCNDAGMMEDVKDQRVVRAIARGDNGEERLTVKEIVAKARLKAFKRELK